MPAEPVGATAVSFGVSGLRKAYGGVEVLKGVDFAVADGEIHALVGANGAGKSTLIKCVGGAVSPDAGAIVIGGRSYASLTPKLAQRAGVAIVHQEPSLVASLDITDNLFLGQELHFGPFLRRRAQRAEATRWLVELGLDLAADADLRGIGNAELQVVEIIKALRRQPKLLILDEPTAYLTEPEAERLAANLRRLRQQNLPILYVTHRLAEVFALADRVTVLRGGEVVLQAPVGEVDPARLVRSIVGRAVTRRVAARSAESSAPPLVNLEGLLAAGIGPIDLAVRPGEIMGVFGLVGAGRTELLETLFGARRRVAGRVTLAGRALHLRHPAEAVAAGIALVPSDRHRKSVFVSLSALDNLLMASFARLARYAIRRRADEYGSFDDAAGCLGLRPHRADLAAGRFSGGNQQKLVLGRWLQEGQDCQLLLLDEPTQGVDVGARSELYGTLQRFVADGRRSVLVTSSEPDELLQLADRVAVLAHGRLAGILAGSAITEHAFMTLAHSAERQEALAA